MREAAMQKKITKREDDYARWYTDVVLQAELADYSPVKGCMVIRPYGYALWEMIQGTLDRMIKETGAQNAYFPLLIPESYLRKEAEHVEGFAPECAVVTHAGGKELEEPLVLRPTSETVIYSMFSKWIMSYRDLPLLINQWANIIRWEMRTRLFLRTTEFLWQEGHTAHATFEEAEEETRKILDVYRDFARDWMALPVIQGRKSESEKFAGALVTYAVEGMMQDRRALQAGTSHNLGQNFARVFEVTYQTKEGKQEFVWNTSWGVSTRLIGALVMAHGDDTGLILPPRLAPHQIVIVPIWTSEDEHNSVFPVAQRVEQELNRDFRVIVDRRDSISLGRKFYEWERKGVPVRIEIGPKDVEKGEVVLCRRDDGKKSSIPLEGIYYAVQEGIEDVQQALYRRASQLLEANTQRVDTFESFREIMDGKGGFLLSHWCGSGECEARVQEETKATLRCIPFETVRENGTCIVCGGESKERVYFAKAY
jgi:prolyl-tRNA synthetase